MKEIHESTLRILWLMWINGVRLKLRDSGYHVEAGSGSSFVHADHIIALNQAGAFMEVESSAPGERHWLLSGKGRQLAAQADRECSFGHK